MEQLGKVLIITLILVSYKAAAQECAVLRKNGSKTGWYAGSIEDAHCINLTSSEPRRSLNGIPIFLELGKSRDSALSFSTDGILQDLVQLRLAAGKRVLPN